MLSRQWLIGVPILAITLLVLGFRANPVEHTQSVDEIVSRIEALERQVDEQATLNRELIARIEVLEAELGIEPEDAGLSADWVDGRSSNGNVSFKYHPDWELTEDEPGSISFLLPDTFQALALLWDMPAGVVQELAIHPEYIEELEAEYWHAEGAQIVQSGSITMQDMPAYYWELIGDIDGFKGRLLVVFVDCSPNNSCMLMIGQPGVRTQIEQEDWDLLEAFLSTLRFSASDSATASRNANLRSCPSTMCSVLGHALAGQALDIVAQNPDATWYKLDSGEWISSVVIDNAPIDLPVIDSPTGR